MAVVVRTVAATGVSLRAVRAKHWRQQTTVTLHERKKRWDGVGRGRLAAVDVSFVVRGALIPSRGGVSGPGSVCQCILEPWPRRNPQVSSSGPCLLQRPRTYLELWV